jgi:hypothetical protein
VGKGLTEGLVRLAKTISYLVSRQDLDRLSAQELAELRAIVERAKRVADAHMVVLVRDILRLPRNGSSRSSRFGSREVEALVCARTGLPKDQVAKYIAMSTALNTAAGVAFLDGTISLDAAYAIQRALPSAD